MTAGGVVLLSVFAVLVWMDRIDDLPLAGKVVAGLSFVAGLSLTLAGVVTWLWRVMP